MRSRLSRSWTIVIVLSLLMVGIFAMPAFSYADEEPVDEVETEAEESVEVEEPAEVEETDVVVEEEAEIEEADVETEVEEPAEAEATEQTAELVTLTVEEQTTERQDSAATTLLNGWNESGTSYYINGELQKGFVAIDGETYYFNPSNGVLLNSRTLIQNSDGKYYFVNAGKVDYSYTGLVKSVSNYYFVRNGVLDYTYTGLAVNIDDGLLHYVENGKQSKNRTGINKSVHDNKYYYVKRGVFDSSYTGLAISESHYYYVENGILDKNYKGIAFNPDTDKYYYVQDGRVDKSFTGVAKSVTNYYFCRKGVLDRTYTGLAMNVDDGKLHYVKNGKQKNNRTGINKSVHDKEYYFVRDGVEDSAYSGLAISVSKWYYVQDGKLDLTYEGPARSTKTRRIYHVEEGKWAKKKTGEVELPDNSYTVKKGVIVDSKVNIGSKKYTLDSDGVPMTLQGIDVSKWQGIIDWEAVKSDGIDFAFVKVGGRGVKTGQLYYDEHTGLGITYGTNLKGAVDAGIKVGVYCFTAAINEEEGREEARYICDLIKDYDVYYPVVIDTEWGYYNDDEGNRVEGRHNPTQLSVEDRTAALKGFCEEVKARGYKPMIYSSVYWFNNYLNMDELSDYGIWCAQWGVDECTYQGDVSVWQYSAEGKVSGIEGNVDMDLMYYEIP